MAQDSSEGPVNGTNGNHGAHVNGSNGHNGDVSASANDIRPVGSYSSSGIDVLVVGTGLAGLTAALECIRKGHNVRVLERYSSINTAGRFSSPIEQAIVSNDR